VTLRRYEETEQCNYQYVVLQIDEQHTRISRDHLLQVLHAENVIARRYFYPGCHRMEPYRSYCPSAKLWLPVTERVAAQLLLLPTGTAMGQAEILEVCELIRFVVSHGAEISRRMAAGREG
jgi:dTDP-4-amino-4,6-dideoxygalactose transaminase